MALTHAESAAQLQKFAFFLKNAAPHEWEQFLQAFEVYDLSVTVAVTRAPPDSVLNAQGAAQQLQLLLTLLAECKDTPEPPVPFAQ